MYQWHGLLWDHTQWRVDCERCVVHLGASERRAGWPGRATELSTNFASTAPCSDCERRRAELVDESKSCRGVQPATQHEIALGMMAPSNTVEVFWESATSHPPA